jgi:hypothetical protein
MAAQVCESFIKHEGPVSLVIKHPKYLHEVFLPVALIKMFQREVLEGISM